MRLSSPVWTSVPVIVASSGHDRRKGLIPRPGGLGCLLRGRSVHMLGMREWLWLIPLDGRGRVLCRRLLGPGAVFYHPKAEWIVELPACARPPPGGITLVLRPESIPEPLGSDGIRTHDE